MRHDPATSTERTSVESSKIDYLVLLAPEFVVILSTDLLLRDGEASSELGLPELELALSSGSGTSGRSSSSSSGVTGGTGTGTGHLEWNAATEWAGVRRIFAANHADTRLASGGTCARRSGWNLDIERLWGENLVWGFSKEVFSYEISGSAITIAAVVSWDVLGDLDGCPGGTGTSGV